MRRLRVLAQLDDTCAVDVAERARASAMHLPERVFQLTTQEIATLQGVSRQSVEEDLERALEKVRVLLRVEIER